MDIVIIGSGNVASVLGTLISDAGHQIRQVAARNELTGRALADRLKTDFCNDFRNIYPNAQLYITAVHDDALHKLPTQLRIHGVIVHTAGSVPMDVLKNISANYGVLYPLQTLRADMDPIPPFPILVDGNTADTLTLITDLAGSISSQVVHANDAYRLKIHLSAVISGNFTNHIFALVKDYCDTNGLDFNLLLPQIRQIVKSLEQGHPADRQTGPAVRNDIKTMNRHKEMLSENPGFAELYRILTDSIQNYHSHK